ncbi:MAG: hypothetical protein KF746_00125 [Chitinophagaceae bacterium]|nr:hypothetical protein [Chitinophagaceae bacterium]
MALLSVTEFLGRFHPVLVHLPIGILLLGVLMHWLSRREQFRQLHPAIGITLLMGALSAVFSCISGLFLAGSGEYDIDVLDRHKWLGIAVAVISIVYYLLYTGKVSLKTPAIVPYIISLLLFLLITITGHLGGTLTHGEGYLSQGFSASGDDSKDVKKIIPDVQAAVAYNDIIQPMLQNKCYSCHGTSKQKGKLRLDTKEFILKGGEEGKTLVAGKGDESEIYKRVILDPLEKKHMPPKGKPQLTEAEITLLHWWINAGASFDQQVKALPQDSKIKLLLEALQSNHIAVPSKPDVPEEPVAAAPQEAVNKLKAVGATVIPVATGSNYLSVNFISSPVVTDKEIKLLEPLAAQLVWLKAGGTSISDSAFAVIGKLTKLTRLGLEHTAITDKGLSSLQSLSKLQYLNIVGTSITISGLVSLKGLPDLHSIYLYQSKVLPADLQALRAAFPKAMLDTGGYTLPVLEGDTSEVKKK